MTIDVEIWGVLGVFFMSGLKLFAAPFVSIHMGFSYSQTLVFTAVGGVAGVWFFYHLSHIIIAIYHRYYTNRFKPYLQSISFFKKLFSVHSTKRIFSKRSRRIAIIRSQYGLLGIIVLTPIFLSIPIGTFLAITYYSKHQHLLAYLAASVVCWTFVLTTIGQLIEVAAR
ncbi:MAG: hypothetical protein HXX14_03355 [Bacteroidetes bacterium]|nr:hypothetical protein [Bacteroidota bacterium]